MYTLSFTTRWIYGGCRGNEEHNNHRRDSSRNYRGGGAGIIRPWRYAHLHRGVHHANYGQWLEHHPGSGYAGVFFGTLVFSILAILICARLKLPVVIPLVAASVQFIPGYFYILTLQDMASIIRLGTSVPLPIVASMISNGLLTLFIAVAIVFGSLLPMLIMNRKTRFY